MVEQIRSLLERTPFQMFSILMADGREYTVPSPDHAHVHPNKMAVSVFTETVEYVLPMRQVSGLGSPVTSEREQPRWTRARTAAK
jgi:hypothetical protein